MPRDEGFTSTSDSFHHVSSIFDSFNLDSFDLASF